MNLVIKQKYSHRCRRQIYSCRGHKVERDTWVVGTDPYTLLYIKQVTDKNFPPFSTRTSAQTL